MRTSKDEESEKVDKVRSALGLCYKPDLHNALRHMRRYAQYIGCDRGILGDPDTLGPSEGCLHASPWKARADTIECQCIRVRDTAGETSPPGLESQGVTWQ